MNNHGESVEFSSVFDPRTNTLNLAVFAGQDELSLVNCRSPLEKPEDGPLSFRLFHGDTRPVVNFGREWKENVVSPLQVRILDIPTTIRRLKFDCSGHLALRCEPSDAMIADFYRRAEIESSESPVLAEFVFTSSDDRPCVWLDTGKLRSDVSVSSVSFPQLPALFDNRIVASYFYLPSGFGVVRCRGPEDTAYLASLKTKELVVKVRSFRLGDQGKINGIPGIYKVDRLSAPEGSKCTFGGRSWSVSELPRNFTIESGGTIALKNRDDEFQGAVISRTPIQGLTIKGGVVEVGRALVEGLALEEVDSVDVGTSQDWDLMKFERAFATNEQIEEMSERQELLDHQFGRPIIRGVSGFAKCLMAEGRTVLDASESGLRVENAQVFPEAELYGLNPVNLDYESLVNLEKVEHLSLWVNPSAKKARRAFRVQLENIDGFGRVRKLTSKRSNEQVLLPALERNQALTRLRERRTRLVGLAVSRRQDGHTLSILREAEKDARTALSPKKSRERYVLLVSQLLTGHGERILRPFLIWVFVLFCLLVAQIGPGRFFSREPWIPWHLSRRVLLFFQFGFPGSSFLDVKSAGGLWGALAKLNSVVFLGAALNAMRKIARGS
jgi:hypothetical protein